MCEKCEAKRAAMTPEEQAKYEADRAAYTAAVQKTIDDMEGLLKPLHVALGDGASAIMTQALATILGAFLAHAPDDMRTDLLINVIQYLAKRVNDAEGTGKVVVAELVGELPRPADETPLKVTLH